MKTVKRMKEDIAILLKELGDMRALCTAENREPSAEERTSANAKLTEIENIEELISLEERTQSTLDRSKEPEREPDKPPIDTRKDKTEREKRDNFASPGEFYQAVMKAGLPGGPVDPRLSTRAATGLSESVPSDGGFLVDTEMSAGLIKNVWDSSPILSRINKVTLSGNKTGMKFNGIDETSRADG
ncbi:MAG: phage major capsid protein, partial [Deltaproteobacteria bacterium]|nr:phage major capsid protein [Deltaproteobacteria bacterium]